MRSFEGLDHSLRWIRYPGDHLESPQPLSSPKSSWAVPSMHGRLTTQDLQEAPVAYPSHTALRSAAADRASATRCLFGTRMRLPAWSAPKGAIPACAHWKDSRDVCAREME